MAELLRPVLESTNGARKEQACSLGSYYWREYPVQKGSQVVSIFISSLQFPCMLSGHRNLGFNDEMVSCSQLLRKSRLLCSAWGDLLYYVETEQHVSS